MAKEIGAFEKYRLQSELIFISFGPVVVQALIGGDLQAGFAATNAVIAAVRRPARARRFCRQAFQETVISQNRFDLDPRHIKRQA